MRRGKAEGGAEKDDGPSLSFPPPPRGPPRATSLLALPALLPGLLTAGCWAPLLRSVRTALAAPSPSGGGGGSWLKGPLSFLLSPFPAGRDALFSPGELRDQLTSPARLGWLTAYQGYKVRVHGAF